MSIDPEQMNEITAYISWLHTHAQDGQLPPVTTKITGISEPIRSAVDEWIVTARESGGWAYPPEWLPSQIDAGKSGLLSRLISGSAPLPKAPPLAYGFPWYEPVEEGYAYLADDDLELTNGKILASANTVVICKTRWTIRHHGDDEFIVTYDSHGEWLLCKLASSEIPVPPPIRIFGGEVVSDPVSWKIERLQDAVSFAPIQAVADPFDENYDPFAETDEPNNDPFEDPFADSRIVMEPSENDDHRSVYEKIEDDDGPFEEMLVQDQDDVRLPDPHAIPKYRPTDGHTELKLTPRPKPPQF